MILTTLFIIFATALLMHLYGLVLDPVKRVLRTQFKTPPKTFLVGHAWQLKDPTKILKVIHNLTKTHGDTFILEVGPFDILLTTIDYKLCETILTCSNNLTKTKIYTFLKPWLGDGLLISDGGPSWKKHRKMLTPAFHFEILKEFIQVYESVGDILISKLKSFNNPQSLDVLHIMSLCALDVICETAMGSQINAQTDENSEYVRGVEGLCRIIVDRTSSPSKIPTLLFMLTKDYSRQKKYLEILHKYSSEMITKKRREKLQKTDQKKTIDDDLGVKRRMAFLDLLLKFSDEGNLLTDNEIRDEVDTFMFAGHDTTSSCISFTLYCLANSQEVQDKALKEQEELFGNDRNPIITYQDLQNMKYLDLVIKESLRLYPPVPIIGRKITQDLKYDDIFIPSGTDVGVFIYGIHRNHKYFTDPERFYPERFNDLDSKLPFVFIPFSAGPRNCIGQKFAMMEIKCIISKILRNFELLPAVPKHEIIMAFEIVLKSDNGIKIGLRERK